MFIDEAERILGLNKMESYCAEDAERAYRNLVKNSHPDVLAAQGAGPNDVNDMMFQLDEAYDLLKDVQGFVVPVDAFRSQLSHTASRRYKDSSWVASLGRKVRAITFSHMRDFAVCYDFDAAYEAGASIA